MRATNCWRIGPDRIRLLMLALLLAWMAARDVAQGDDDPAAERQQAKSAARLQQMKTLAVKFEMKALPDDGQKPLELRPEPIFRYSDQPRGFEDATLWAWTSTGSSGRPAVIAKVEAAVTPAQMPYWHFCVTSLADKIVSADFEGATKFISKRAGVELQKIPSGPEPGDKNLVRQRQMKELVGRFAATIYNTNPDTRKQEPQEMRLLVTAIHRYSDEANGLQDGTIFGLTTNGTNPDMLIVIELHRTKGAAWEWKYAIVKMTIAEVHVRLDDVEVWKSIRNAPRDTWESFTKMPREE